MRCKHENCSISQKFSYSHTLLISNGDLQLGSDGEPILLGYEIYCEDCGYFYTFSPRNLPKWVAKIIQEYGEISDDFWNYAAEA